jgi:hypothetical protein
VSDDVTYELAGNQPGTIIVECSHGHVWEMPSGWRIEGITAIVCRDGEDVLAAAGYGFREFGAFTLDTTGMAYNMAYIQPETTPDPPAEDPDRA